LFFSFAARVAAAFERTPRKSFVWGERARPSLALARRGRVCYLASVSHDRKPVAFTLGGGARGRERSAAARALTRVAELALASVAVAWPAGPAAAHEAYDPLSSAPTPPSPPGEGATAEKVLAEVDAKVKELDGPAKPAAPSAKDAMPAVPATEGRAAKVVAEPVRMAREALERARGTRVSGDAAHTRRLEALALEWAETARDVLRAMAAEDAAGAEQKRARELGTEVDRARALLEETQARRGRAAAEAERAETAARDAAKTAAEAEDARVAAGGRAKRGGGKAEGAPKAAKKAAGKAHKRGAP
jgi:hypothetical protein